MRKSKLLGVSFLALLFCCFGITYCNAQCLQDDNAYKNAILDTMFELPEDTETESETINYDISDSNVTVMYPEYLDSVEDAKTSDTADDALMKISDKHKKALVFAVAALLITIAFAIRYCIRK